MVSTVKCDTLLCDACLMNLNMLDLTLNLEEATLKLIFYVFSDFPSPYQNQKKNCF